MARVRPALQNLVGGHVYRSDELCIGS